MQYENPICKSTGQCQIVDAPVKGKLGTSNLWNSWIRFHAQSLLEGNLEPKVPSVFFCRCDWAVHSSSVEKPEVDEIDWNLEPFFDMFFPKLVSLINNPIKDVPFKNYVNEVSNEVLAKKKRTISQLGHHFFAAWSSWAAPCLRVQLIGCKSQQKRWSLVAQCLKRGGWMPHG